MVASVFMPSTFLVFLAQILLSVFGVEQEDKLCADGWDSFQDPIGAKNCYKWFAEELPFDDANKMCAANAPNGYNGSLASFQTTDEFKFLQSIQEKQPTRVLSDETAGTNAGSWIGMTHSPNPVEGAVPEGMNRFELSFVDGTGMFNFSAMSEMEYGEYWGSAKEPNGVLEWGFVRGCVSVAKYPEGWGKEYVVMDDVNCGLKRSFICKYVAVPKPSTTTTTTIATTSTTTAAKTTPVITVTTTPVTLSVPNAFNTLITNIKFVLFTLIAAFSFNLLYI
ncbi:hypothetical protein DdX_14066 [Ditylenchus destructor]|uniref:C-type lectin domain-containing protein n=1 Tax=Ditylenchus destructor TaxID=166010 RepID=A0AAD4MTE5_9BILA|nr:hypothetical protein DdX_14066 [Ditylenchus destructor]